MNWPSSIPESWRWSTMGDVTTVVGGGTPDTRNPAYFGGDISWLTPADLSGYTAKHVSGGARNLTQAGLESSGAQMMPAGSVLFSSRAPIGYVAIAANPICTNQGFKSFALEAGILSDFVYYYLQHAKPLALKLASGTTFLEISGKNTTRIPVPIAPSAEQSRVADALDELFSDLDAGVAALERVREKLKLYRASVLKAAVEGALTAEWRAQHPHTEPATELLERILAERRRHWEEDQLAKCEAKCQEPPKNWRARYKEPVAPDTSNLLPLPDGWCWATLDQISFLVTSGSRGWKEYYADDGALFIRSQDIRTDRLDLGEAAHVSAPKDSEGTRTKVCRGDLLVTITGANVTKAAMVEGELTDAYVSQHVGLVRLVSPELGHFVHMYVVAPSGGRMRLLKSAYGAGKPGLNLDNLRELPIPLTPVQEYKRIVEAVEDQLSVIDHLEADLDDKLKNAKSLRQAILCHAFTGKLVQQDPNDEPASELLKRIAAKREARGASISRRRRAR